MLTLSRYVSKEMTAQGQNSRVSSSLSKMLQEPNVVQRNVIQLCSEQRAPIADKTPAQTDTTRVRIIISPNHGKLRIVRPDMQCNRKNCKNRTISVGTEAGVFGASLVAPSPKLNTDLCLIRLLLTTALQ